MFARKIVKNDEGNFEKTVISKLLIGAPDHNLHASFQWYEMYVEEMFDIIVSELKKIHSELNS